MRPQEHRRAKDQRLGGISAIFHRIEGAAPKVQIPSHMYAQECLSKKKTLKHVL